eukprot:TRINITY_DN17066_c0_g1_i1.p1 TRINITY_DN17066_c0_g1~~TRINITY_DN17066_c0_g1_i1.p1  ORF type:complete len:189 (+),score=5.98 TRINITY_DN17066_c0_g1_i1:77-643(+)
MAVFGCVLPGLPPAYQFQQVDATHWTLPLGVLRSDQLVVFLTGAAPCPEGTGVGVYLSRQGAPSFEYVGTICNTCPSGVFRVPVTLVDVARETPLALGLALEPLAHLASIEQTGARQRQANALGVTWGELAGKLARDCGAYITNAIAQSGIAQPGQGVLVVGADCVRKWLSRVTTRFQHDSSWWAAGK